MKATGGKAGGPQLAVIPIAVAWRVLLLVVVCYAFLLRVLYAVGVELLPEETYYWNYSRHLDLGYLDHPPMVAWLIRLGTSLCGDTEFGVRLGAIACGATAAAFLFRLTRNMFGADAALSALALTATLPFFFMSGVLMTPDAPLTAAWAASLYFTERALVAGKAQAWLWTGLAVGLGLLSKYTIALLAIAIALFMCLDPASRRWWRRWEPYAALLIAGTVFAPVIYWNFLHEWASFAFQTSRRLAERPRFSVHKLIGGAIVLITPTGVWAAVRAFRREVPRFWGGRTLERDGQGLKLLCLCVLVPLTVFFVFSLRHEVKLDWTGAPWVGAVPLLAAGIARSYERVGRRLQQRVEAAWPATVAMLLLIYSIGLCYLVFGLPGIGYSRHVELVPIGWRSFGRQIESVANDLRLQTGGDVLVVGMDRYAIASELAFYAKDRFRSVAATTSGHLFGNMGLMYERWFPISEQAGRTLLLVSWDEASLLDPRIAKRCDRLDTLREAALMRGEKTIRPYYFRVAYGYHPQVD